MKFHIVDAFTDQAFGGNTAGVVPLEAGAAFPADELMRRIAAELRYSETAFVRQDGPDGFTVRYFTPAGEIDLCGHATIATFGTLFREGIVPEGRSCRCRTRAGELEIVPGPVTMMQMAAPRKVGTFESPELLAALLSAMGGLKADALSELPVEIISTGLPDIILPLRDTTVLQTLKPDMPALAALSIRFDVVGVHALAFGEEDGYTAHVRNFAPRYDIPEESATGTANAALTYYLYRHGRIAADTRCAFLQGEAMGRPSTVLSTIRIKEGRPDICVGGPCAIVASGELRV